ncbi:MAG: DNA cytosine methyltransferase [Pseudomonadales bacterium]|nr:DNA cytosine methyltransferase [Pseudomonadales bacterium]
MSAGLRSAGFRVIAGADIEPKYIATFRHNFNGAKTLDLDLANREPNELMSDLDLEPEQLDLLAGGPPCQGFSKNVPRRIRYMDDPNNQLISTFLRYCEGLRPKLILMENVAEMKNGFSQRFTDEIVNRLQKAGYFVTHATLNAAEYGVPQRRRRAFFLAARAGVVSVPPATHMKSPGDQLTLVDTPIFLTVWDAIGDLPSVRHGEGKDPCPYASAPFTDYQRLMRNGRSSVRNHIARKLEKKQYDRLASLEPGQGHKDLPSNLQTRGGYSGAYGRLTKEMTAPTITRWVFHPGSGRWGHPVDTRTLTIREIARIQGFKDDFEFVGSFVQQAGQLGNAVPPMLIDVIASSMRLQLGI